MDPLALFRKSILQGPEAAFLLIVQREGLISNPVSRVYSFWAPSPTSVKWQQGTDWIRSLFQADTAHHKRGSQERSRLSSSRPFLTPAWVPERPDLRALRVIGQGLSHLFQKTGRPAPAGVSHRTFRLCRPNRKLTQPQLSSIFGL